MIWVLPEQMKEEKNMKKLKDEYIKSLEGYASFLPQTHS